MLFMFETFGGPIPIASTPQIDADAGATAVTLGLPGGVTLTDGTYSAEPGGVLVAASGSYTFNPDGDFPTLATGTPALTAAEAPASDGKTYRASFTVIGVLDITLSVTATQLPAAGTVLTAGDTLNLYLGASPVPFTVVAGKMVSISAGDTGEKIIRGHDAGGQIFNLTARGASGGAATGGYVDFRLTGATFTATVTDDGTDIRSDTLSIAGSDYAFFQAAAAATGNAAYAKVYDGDGLVDGATLDITTVDLGYAKTFTLGGVLSRDQESDILISTAGIRSTIRFDAAGDIYMVVTDAAPLQVVVAGALNEAGVASLATASAAPSLPTIQHGPQIVDPTPDYTNNMTSADNTGGVITTAGTAARISWIATGVLTGDSVYTEFTASVGISNIRLADNQEMNGTAGVNYDFFAPVTAGANYTDTLVALSDAPWLGIADFSTSDWTTETWTFSARKVGAAGGVADLCAGKNTGDSVDLALIFPDAASFASTEGSLSGSTLTLTWSGERTVTVTAFDARGVPTTQTATIDVTLAAADATMRANDPMIYATDADALALPLDGAYNTATMEITRLDGNTLSSDGMGNVYTTADGEWVYANDRGSFGYHPKGRFDYLDAGEHVDVAITWRRTGDVSDRTRTIRVYGSEAHGDDLARSVSPVSGDYTLLDDVPEGAILEVIYTTTGAGDVTWTLGAVDGPTLAANAAKQSVNIRAGAITNLLSVATTGTAAIASVIAKVLVEPASAAAVRTLSAVKSGSTVDLAWTAIPRAGVPDFVTGMTRSEVGTSFSNIDGTAILYHDGYGTSVAGSTAGTTDALKLGLDGVTFSRVKVAVVAEGFTTVYARDVTMTDAFSFAPSPETSDPADYPSSPTGYLWDLTRDKEAPASGAICWVMDSLVERNDNPISDAATPRSLSNTEMWNGDAPSGVASGVSAARHPTTPFYFLNIDSGGWTDCAFADTRWGYYANCVTTRTSWKHLRQWTGPAMVTHWNTGAAAEKSWFWLGYMGAFYDFWRAEIGGVTCWAEADVPNSNDVPITYGISAFWSPADSRVVGAESVHFRAMRPALPAEVDIQATDWEFQQSTDGSTWSALSVPDTGINDSWGSLRRAAVACDASATHIRVRAKFGATLGAWKTEAVT